MPPVRVLESGTEKLVLWKDVLSKHPNAKYAVLSHRWRPGEVTFQTLHGGQIPLRDLPSEFRDSREKLQNACTKAKEAGCSFLWADTVCINKSDSQERQESLNSMYAYYAEAATCIAFLDDVEVSTGMGSSIHPERRGKKSEWFSRGWT